MSAAGEPRDGEYVEPVEVAEVYRSTLVGTYPTPETPEMMRQRFLGELSRLHALGFGLVRLPGISPSPGERPVVTADDVIEAIGQRVRRAGRWTVR